MNLKGLLFVVNSQIFMFSWVFSGKKLLKISTIELNDTWTEN